MNSPDNQIPPYKGPILSGPDNYFKWAVAVNRYLTAMKVITTYTVDLGDDWIKKASETQLQDQKAAIATLGFFVDDHIYNLYLEPEVTAPRAWKNLINAYVTKDHHEADRLKEELKDLKFVPGGDALKHIVAMEELICAINSHSSEPLSERERIYYLMVTLPKTVLAQPVQIQRQIISALSSHV